MKFRSLLLSSFLASSLPIFADTSSYDYEILDTKAVGTITLIPQNLPKTKSSFDQKIYLKRLKTQPGELFSQTAFDDDLKMLAEDFEEVEPLIDAKNGTVDITLKVWIRPQISSITWTGNEKFSVKKLRKEFGVKVGQPLNRDSLYKGINNLREFYAKKGYFEADIQPYTEYDKENNEVSLTIKINEGRTGKIQKIEYVGFSKEEQKLLSHMIYTKQYNLLISWFLGTGIYNEEAIEQDQQNITNFLQNRGYADARVKISVLDAATPGRVIVEIKADKGQVYRLGKISFKGNHVIDDKTLDDVFVSRPGNTYSPEALRNSSNAISDLYGSKGYIDASVNFETIPHEDEAIYDVKYTINEGEKYHVGLIQILGNASTQEKVILRETALVPGEVFNMARLKETQQRLEALGYFQNVNVYAVKTSDYTKDQKNYRDVHVEVKEGMTGNAGIFLGFSSSEHVFGGIDIGENNFNIAGIPRIFKDGLSAVRGAGQIAKAKANIGQKQRSYSLSWMDPYFYDSNWRFGFDVIKNTSDVTSDDYTNDSYGFTVYTAYPLSAYWTYGMKYRFRDEYTKANKDLNSIAPNPSSDPGYTQMNETPKQRLERQERYELKIKGLISAFALTMTYDSTFIWNGKPRKGLRSSTELEYVGVGGKFDFGKIAWTNVLYSSLWSKGVMKYRLDFKSILPTGKSNAPYEIPLGERFYLGGETTVRGYHPYSLGPQYAYGKNTKQPRGGISSFLASVEYNQEIFKFLDAFAFADAGSISLRRVYFGNYKLSYGAGVRIQLLGQMPIMVGYGNAVNPGKTKTQKVFFMMGGQF